MRNAGPLIEELYAATDAVEAADRRSVMRALNHAYMEIAGMASWEGMRRTIKLSDGDWIPANLTGIDAAYNDAGALFEQRDKSAIKTMQAQDRVPRFFYQNVRQSPLAVGDDLTVTNGKTVISFLDKPPEAQAGEFIVIGDTSGMWELASDTDLVDKFSGPTGTVSYQLGPVGQKQIGIVDASGNPVSGELTIDCWMYPLPIFGASDVVLLPQTEALMLKTLRRYYKITKKDLPRGMSLNDEYERAIEECKAQNPRYNAPSMTTGLRGEKLGWGAVR